MSIADQLKTRNEMLDLAEVAKVLGSHPQTLYKACRSGKMPHLRVGSRIKFDPPTIAAWLESRQVG